MSDGTITIDSAISTKGFEDGINLLIGKLKPLAIALLGVMGVKSVMGISKLTAEFQRLGLAAQGVGQMYGFTSSQSRALIQDLIKSGIQTDIATKAFINFAREGLDTSMLPALARGAQDLNVFADAGASSSEVMNSLLTGVLKLDSQILRNAGVAVDLAGAYNDLAKKLGKSAGALTIQEQRQAALIAVTEKLKGVSGLYELSQKSLAGQLSSNKRIMTELHAALGVPFQDALFQIVKGFNTFIKALTVAIKPGGRFYAMIVNIGAILSVVGRIIHAVFGALASFLGVKIPQGGAAGSRSLDKVAKSTQGAASAQQNLAGGITKAAKAAKGALASFDQLNVLQTEEIDPNAGGGGGGPDIPDMGGILGGIDEFDPSKIIDPLDAIRQKADEVSAAMATLFAPLLAALDRLRIAVEPLGLTLWSGLVWVWENILKPLGLWAANTLLPVVFDLLAAASETLNTALIALKPIGVWLWENFLKPAAAFVGTALIDYLKYVTESFKKLTTWIQNNEKAFQAIIVVIGILAIALFFILNPFALIVVAVIAIIAVLILLVRNWDRVKEWAIKSWDAIKRKIVEVSQQIITNIQTFMDRIWTSISNRLDLIKQKWQDTFTGIKDFIRTTINSIIGFVNGMIQAITRGINAVVDGLNSFNITIPAWIPGIGGSSWSLNIPYMSAPNIPYLAKGAVIPPNAAFAAVLGDQRSGMNIEAPAELIRQIVREELGNIKADITIGFEGSLAALVRELQPYIERESVRLGGSFIKGKVTT